MNAPIPERHPAGRSCAGLATTLAALITITAALIRKAAP